MSNGPEPFEQLWKRTNQGSFLWCLVKIQSVVYEEMSFENARTDARTAGRMHDEQNVITKAHLVTSWQVN